ncbi:thioredoxin domain-containing protein [Bacillus mangrovi]|uniref:Thioredoxin domain-containing protein n=1 Tax=Metabacillus mangrovi TaxID=1491830 RepID=A0A7X2S6H1_9BACI|nr:DsbA family oxidoreductase [Metabacillus mangrovi]MTH54380.1 thioredoxin domain-containing protein [Metabacillus mangrovi]
MTVKIQVYSDFVCPFCFIGEEPLRQAADGRDVEIEFMPFELRPYPMEGMSPKSDYIQQAYKQSVQPLAKRFGVDMELPMDLDPVPSTHLAHQGYQFAREEGEGRAYVDAVFKAYWQEGQNIGDMNVLTGIARELGLNEAAFQDAITGGTYVQDHKEALGRARAEEIQAVPTFIIGNQRLQGLHSKEAIELAIDEQSNAGIKPGESCGPEGC